MVRHALAPCCPEHNSRLDARLEKNVKGSTCSIDDAMRHFGIREYDIEAAEDPELS
jgi:hypothetical protein